MNIKNPIFPLIFVIGIGCYCQAPEEWMVAHTEAEMKISNIVKKLQTARNSVLLAIKKIKDPNIKQTMEMIFTNNEEAWHQLMISETLLQYGATNSKETPNAKYLRITEANNSHLRIEQYEKFSRWLSSIK